MTGKSDKISDFKALETIAVFSCAGLVFGLLFKKQAAFHFSLYLLIAGVFLPKLSKIIAGGWLVFAAALGTVNTRIILTLLYYAVLTPVAFIYRLTKGDVIGIKRRAAGAESLWHSRDHQYKPEDLLKPW